VARALPSPSQPTAEEIAQHRIAHLPARTWCEARIQGRGKEHPLFRRQEVAEGAVPLIALDYGHLGDRPPKGVRLQDDVGAPGLLLVLVARDVSSKAIAAIPVEGKGVNPAAVKALASWARCHGHSRVVLKGDQKPSLKALRDEVLRVLKEDEKMLQAALEMSPGGHSQANGSAEQAVGAMQAQARTLLVELEQRLGTKLGPLEPIISWLASYAGTCLTLFQRSSDGRTPFERLRGRKWKDGLPELGKRVMVKTKTLWKILSRFRPAIYLGIKLETGETIVAITGMPDGESQIHVVRTVKRVPTASAWDLDIFKKIKGVPWNPSSQGASSCSGLDSGASSDCSSAREDWCFQADEALTVRL
jgi:hypothetical protein